MLAFSSSDATLAPLGVGAKVVVLTSQCWDESLKTRVAERLASELKPGALVVDYGVRRADRRRRGAHQLEREAEVLRVPEEGDDRGL